ncbi:MAG: cytochrome c [Alphaproteobacteria bacterium]|nr:cytochrome c [Alphaproteobacteria bacterium]
MTTRSTAASLLLLLLVSACMPAPERVGKALYVDHCIACHGKDARGDGPLSSNLDRNVPDLTLIAARNGGEFPLAEVISTIDGYTRSRAGNTVMPEFGIDLQSGPLVYLETGDGIRTPTPSRLVALAEYLRSIQN